MGVAGRKLTRATNPFLDVLAWLPYGVIHFVAPFVVAALLWIPRPRCGGARISG
jgi:hypothetical protein